MNVSVMRFAIEAHEKVNHLYDGAPYSLHLAMVVSYAYKFIDTIPDIENHRDNVIAACWLHDTIEDCRLTYNDIKEVAGVKVADMVYALTNEKGKTRADRANHLYYAGIRNTIWATYVKVCDRLANAKYSAQTGSRMLAIRPQRNRITLISTHTQL